MPQFSSHQPTRAEPEGLSGNLVAKFLDAQNKIYPQALQELRSGHKQTHWMWFIFPQIAGLGRSPTAQHYAIQSLAEAEQYLHHAVLGSRLRECTQAVLLHEPGSASPRTLRQIFGSPDDLKFHSSVTLFHRADPEDPVFTQSLRAFFSGQEDRATLELI